MNLHKTLFLSALALSLLSVKAFSEEDTFIAFDTDEAVAITRNRAARPVIEKGDTIKRVLTTIGNPASKLSPTEWVYQRIETTLPGATKSTKEWSLVIAFKNDRIDSIKIVSERILRTLTAEAKRNVGTTVAVNSPRNP
jgi:hypothetical protein